VKNLKLLLVLVPVAAFIFFISGCSKSNNNSTPSTKDSILYSPWMSLSATFSNTDSAFEQNIAASHITQDIIDHGAILSFIKDNLGEIVPPDDFGLVPFYSVGNILLIANADFSQTMYRYVVIPGSVPVTNSAGGVVSGTGRTLSVADLKQMSYDQVVKALNIPADGGTIK
jgi:hypothetical protein